MNFLAHLHLSGDEPLVMVGNFMADAVKGRDLSAHHPLVQKGIRRHRRIDSFTDQHPITAVGRERVRAHCGKYAGVALDLFYDHLLASEWERHREEPLSAFAQRCYVLLQREQGRLPERTRDMLPYLVKGDWLASYATITGIGKALHGLSKRAYHAEALNGAESVLHEHIDVYRGEFRTFLAELVEHIRAVDNEG
ncbi:MAG: ACP phosphodiesterase [Flavobacteriales bacterium]